MAVTRWQTSTRVHSVLRFSALGHTWWWKEGMGCMFGPSEGGRATSCLNSPGHRARRHHPTCGDPGGRAGVAEPGTTGGPLPRTRVVSLENPRLRRAARRLHSRGCCPCVPASLPRPGLLRVPRADFQLAPARRSRGRPALRTALLSTAPTVPQHTRLRGASFSPLARRPGPGSPRGAGRRGPGPARSAAEAAVPARTRERPAAGGADSPWSRLRRGELGAGSADSEGAATGFPGPGLCRPPRAASFARLPAPRGRGRSGRGRGGTWAGLAPSGPAPAAATQARSGPLRLP